MNTNTKTNLSTKEKYLLEDQKSHEELCIKKYTNYANQAKDPELKTLFSNLANSEQQHYNTVDQIMKGQVPPASTWQQQSGQQSQGMQAKGNQQQPQGMQMKGQQQSQGMQMSGQQQPQGMQMSGQQQPQGMQMQKGTGLINQSDMDLCQDMLGTEKYISSAYNTAIFEFRDHDIRAALNHIQKEEQEHGEKVFNYMNSHGGYSV